MSIHIERTGEAKLLKAEFQKIPTGSVFTLGDTHTIFFKSESAAVALDTGLNWTILPHEIVVIVNAKLTWHPELL